MIGALGLGLIGTGIIFIWAGWRDRKVGDFFAQLKGAPAGEIGTSGPPPADGDLFRRGDFAGEPALPPVGVPR